MSEQYAVLTDEFSTTDGVQVQIGTDGRALGALPYWGTWGVISRPLPATSANAARVLVSGGVAHSGVDERGLELASRLKPGETAIYAAGSKARIVLKLDGTIALVSEDLSGNTALIQIGPSGFDVAFNSARMHLDAEKFSVANSSGVIGIASGSIKFMAKSINAMGKFVWNTASGNAAISATPPAIDLGTALTAVNNTLLYLKGLI
jgi:phage gp45-like